MRTLIYALMGLFLILVAIPLGLMLAPLVIGAILVAVGVRRADRSLQAVASGAAA